MSRTAGRTAQRTMGRDEDRFAIAMAQQVMIMAGNDERLMAEIFDRALVRATGGTFAVVSLPDLAEVRRG